MSGWNLVINPTGLNVSVTYKVGETDTTTLLQVIGIEGDKAICPNNTRWPLTFDRKSK